MYASITDHGLLIPKEWLRGLTNFEIRRVGEVILITPTDTETLSTENMTKPEPGSEGVPPSMRARGPRSRGR